MGRDTADLQNTSDLNGMADLQNVTNALRAANPQHDGPAIGPAKQDLQTMEIAQNITDLH